MRKGLLTLTLTILLAATSAFAQQQIRSPRPSPKASIMQSVGITDITINYNRPGVKGRQIWGALVPFDKVWRTGANEATTIQFSDDVWINGNKLAKGLYSLHTIPNATEWTVIFNSVAEQWGSYSYDAAKDALRIKVAPQAADHREWLTFEIPEMTTDTAKVVIRWENVAVPFTVDTQATQKSLDAAAKAIAAMDTNRWMTPYRAADFAFTANRMDEAQKWLDMSLKEQETLANLWLKARMLHAQGRKADALRTAEQAIAKATPEQKDFAAEVRKQSQAWK